MIRIASYTDHTNGKEILTLEIPFSDVNKFDLLHAGTLKQQTIEILQIAIKEIEKVPDTFDPKPISSGNK